MGEDYIFNQNLLQRKPLFGFNQQSTQADDTSNTSNFMTGQVTSKESIFNSPDANSSLTNQSSGGLFSDWNQQSTSNLFKGMGTMGGLFLGYKNLGLAEDSMKIKKEQHQGWKDDRAEAKIKRDNVSAIRF